ncbi:MAG: voltage-gated potassium channel [Myxococcota bacterium]|jgi:voltage-gated potassium channel
MERTLRRLLAEVAFRLYALRMLMVPMALLVVTGALGAALHHRFGAPPGGGQPSWSESVYITYNLFFLEHLAPLPEHIIGQVVQYLWPLLGIFLLAEGLLKVGITVFRKEDNLEIWMPILAKTSNNHIILCGLGSVGFRVLEELVGMGEQVFAVEISADCPLLEQARQLGAEVIVGDARAENLLRSLNIEKARAVIVATDDDLANLEIAMDVREIREDVPVVMRLFDQRLAQKVRHALGIEVTFSTSRLAAPLLAAAALDDSIVGAHRVGGEVLVVLELTIAQGSRLDGASISELVGVHQLTVIAHRDGEVWVPQPRMGQHLAPGDQVQVMVRGDRVAAVRRLNSGSGPG